MTSTCEFTNHPLGLKKCGATAANEIVRRDNGKRVGLRCKQHTANMDRSELFRVRALPSAEASK